MDEIEGIFIDVFEEVTFGLSGIELRTLDNKDKEELSGNILSGIIKTIDDDGITIVGTTTDVMVNEISNAINGGEELNIEEQELYYKEYLNIIFGRFLSELKKVVSIKSRFTVPIIIEGEFKEYVNSHKNKCEVYFWCKYGIIKIYIIQGFAKEMLNKISMQKNVDIKLGNNS